MTDFKELWESAVDSRDPQRSKIFHAVKGLGTSADAIAESLKIEGVTGEVKSPGSCALSAYIYKHFPDAEVETGGDILILDYSSADTGELHYLPQAHRDFVQTFDQGGYPDLLKP